MQQQSTHISGMQRVVRQAYIGAAHGVCWIQPQVGSHGRQVQHVSKLPLLHPQHASACGTVLRYPPKPPRMNHPLTAHEGRGNALPGLNCCPGVGICGDFHAQVTAQDGGAGTQDKGNHGEQAVLHLVSTGPAVLRGHRSKQGEDQDGHNDLRARQSVSLALSRCCLGL